MKILWVDDEPSIGRFGAKCAHAAGWYADYVESPHTAFRQVLEHHYDVIVLDLVMRNLSGIQLLRQIRGAGVGTPAIILSGFFSDEIMAEALHAGAYAVLQKPVRPANLIAEINRVASGTGKPGRATANEGRRDSSVDDLSAPIRRLLEVLSPLTAPSTGGAAEALAVALADPDLTHHQFAICARAFRGVRSAGVDSLRFVLTRLREDLCYRHVDDSRVVLAMRRLETAGLRCHLIPEVELAAELGLSASHFGRLLREKTGFSVGEHCSLLRIRPGVFLLAGGDDRVSQISYACGFDAQSQFSRELRERFGLTPTRYREVVRLARLRRQ